MFIGYYNYTVLLTYFGLCSAVYGMMQAMKNDYRTAIICLLICGLCDMFDGMIARTNKTRSEDAKSFGVQIDSLCDLVCFGVFPVIIGFALSPASWFTVLAAAFFVLAAVIRLGYFNVEEMNRMGGSADKRHYYTGLPVTASALIMPMVALITTLKGLHLPFIYPLGLAITGVLNISRFRVRKPYTVGIVCMIVVGALVFYLAYRYGGSITCMKPGAYPTNV